MDCGNGGATADEATRWENDECGADLRAAGRTPNVNWPRKPIMRTVHEDVCADDYIRRIDRLTWVTGAITMALAARLFV